MRVLKPFDVGFWEKLLSNASFAGAAVANDYPNLPIILFDWKGPLEMLL
jgi:hypothetical protein